jgi:hypothetical protein
VVDRWLQNDTAGSFRGADHLRRILEEAQAMVSNTLAAAP